MYQYINVTKKSWDCINKYNHKIREFNELNKDFFDEYKSSKFLEQIFLKRSVRAVFKDDILVGFLWYEKNSEDIYNINSFFIDPNSVNEDLLESLFSKFKKGTSFSYDCINNGNNYIILDKLGFELENRTLELSMELNGYFNIDELDCGLSFEILKEGKQEILRCELQNEIFKNDNRIPLTIDDIFYDETQSYYIKSGGMLLKYNNFYIGYGQVIMDENCPTIVNFGILPSYRGLGYSKIFIKRLLNFCFDKGFFKIKIKVSFDNTKAINLYKSIGFNITRDIGTWILKK